MAVWTYRCDDCKKETAVALIVLRIEPIIPCPYCNGQARRQQETPRQSFRLRTPACPVRWSRVSRRTPPETAA